VENGIGFNRQRGAGSRHGLSRWEDPRAQCAVPEGTVKQGNLL